MLEREITGLKLVTFYDLYPRVPSVLMNFGKPSNKPLANAGLVWTRTLTASKGQRAISAISSADAEPAR